MSIEGYSGAQLQVHGECLARHWLLWYSFRTKWSNVPRHT